MDFQGENRKNVDHFGIPQAVSQQFPAVSLKIPVFQKLLKAGESGLGDPNASLAEAAV